MIIGIWSDTLKVLEINEAKIVFKTLVSGIETIDDIQQIAFNDNTKYYEGSFDLLYSNGTMWTYAVTDNKTLHLVHSGDKEAKGRTYIVCGNDEMYFERIKKP